MKPTVSHRVDRCLKCGGDKGTNEVWCSGCVNNGRDTANASLYRQIAAGRPMDGRNWQPGDPRWWEASGCYE